MHSFIDIFNYNRLGEKCAKMGLFIPNSKPDIFLKADGPLNISLYFFFHKVPS